MMMPVLDAQSLNVRRGERLAVRGVSLAFEAGQWTAIVGPNGAGKSSLLSVLAGLRAPDSGIVTLMGRPIADWPSRERGQRVAWLSQDGAVDAELAVRDVVRLGRLPHLGLFGAPRRADEAAVDDALRETECDGLAARRLSALSGGERQRVLLARALAVRSRVLLLDEPTSHLDAPHQVQLARSLRTQAQGGVAVASVLHDLTLALMADRLVVMDQGRIVADGRPADAVLRRTLAAVFDEAFTIEAIGAARWAVVPRL
jgi:iron complex transport system ATP-binding protein